MIKDLKLLNEIREEWKGVRSLQRTIGIGELDAVSKGSLASFGIVEVAHNLTLIFAFSVLKDVLTQLRDEGYYKCSNRDLKPLMYKSKKSIPWVDFQKIDRGRDIRNEIAHDNKMFHKEECFKYIDALEYELKAWSIIE